MTERENGRRDGSDVVGRLLGLGGPRPAPDAAAASRVRDAVHAEWRLNVRRRRVRRWTLAAGVPAVAAAAVVVFLLMPIELPVPQPRTGFSGPMPSAVLESATGTDVRVLRRGTFAWAPLPPAGTLPADSVLETGAGTRASLRTTLGFSIRVDAGTRLRMIVPYAVTLDRGVIYVDDPPAVGSKTVGLLVRTRLGTVTHQGTQYEVRLDDLGLRVRVREGRARVYFEGQEHVATAGTELRIGQYGSVRRQAIQTFGPDWAWTLGVAPSMVIEGERLDAFLAWIAREMGWFVRFADDALARESSGTILHGSINGLTPGQAVGSVLATCGLAYDLRDGTLLIRNGRDGERRR